MVFFLFLFILLSFSSFNTYVFLLVFILVILTAYFFIFKRRSFTIFFYPIFEFIAKVFNLNIKRFKRDFISLSNYLLKIDFKKVKHVLLILPHCIQNSECKHRITSDNLENCVRCGKCSIKDILEVTSGIKNLTVYMATGGTSARVGVQKYKPDLIIAIACENDLTSGIRDVKSIPVVGILNFIKDKPCQDTLIDFNLLKKYINLIEEKI